jgi:acyl carrier protein
METNFLAFIKEVLEIEDRELQFEDEFRTYDEWDSLARLSLIASIDDTYEVVIEDEVFKNLKTLNDLHEEILKRKA